MSNSGLENPSPKEAPRAARFFAGVLWNWVGVALNIAIGLLLSPYIARKLGSERYGIWALVFSLVEYLWFFDLGFNTSVTQFVAKYRARNEPEQINRVINTGLVYFCCVAIVFALATLLVAWRGVALFKIADPVNREDFRVMILIVGLGWALNFPLHFFSSCLDAFQRYDHLTRTWVAQLLIRSVGCALLLYFGFGLKELGAVVVLGQLVGNGLAMLAFRSVFPADAPFAALREVCAGQGDVELRRSFLRRQHFQPAAESGGAGHDRPFPPGVFRGLLHVSLPAAGLLGGGRYRVSDSSPVPTWWKCRPRATRRPSTAWAST
jgi:Na+-driven multidrug efflux pump